MLLTIDSGEDCGWAVFRDKELVLAGLRAFKGVNPRQITRIVVERPHSGRTQARKKDILTLAIRAGELGGIWSYLTGVVPKYVEPQSWGGSVAKVEKNRRVLKRLSDKELAVCPRNRRGQIDHNVLDAIGIGLAEVARFF